jgi:hypothetical protein
MKVVVALTQSDQCGNNVIARGVSVIKWLEGISTLRPSPRKTMTDLLTQPMGKRVDAKSGLLNKQKPKNACIHQTTLPIAPAQASYKHWKQHPEHQDDRSIIPVLPDDDRVFVQVRDIRSSLVFGILLQDHPHEVRVPDSLHYTIGVVACICETVMRTMLS